MIDSPKIQRSIRSGGFQDGFKSANRHREWMAQVKPGVEDLNKETAIRIFHVGIDLARGADETVERKINPDWQDAEKDIDFYLNSDAVQIAGYRVETIPLRFAKDPYPLRFNSEQ